MVRKFGESFKKRAGGWTYLSKTHLFQSVLLEPCQLFSIIDHCKSGPWRLALRMGQPSLSFQFCSRSVDYALQFIATRSSDVSALNTAASKYLPRRILKFLILMQHFENQLGGRYHWTISRVTVRLAKGWECLKQYGQTIARNLLQTFEQASGWKSACHLWPTLWIKAGQHIAETPLTVVSPIEQNQKASTRSHSSEILEIPL